MLVTAYSGLVGVCMVVVVFLAGYLQNWYPAHFCLSVKVCQYEWPIVTLLHEKLHDLQVLQTQHAALFRFQWEVIIGCFEPLFALLKR